VEWLRERAARDPAAEALVDGETRLGFGDLQAAASAMAARLREAGVAAHDRVGLACENSAAFVAAYLGILGCGAVLVPLNPASPPADVEAAVEDTSMACLVADAARVPSAAQNGTIRVRLDEVLPGRPAGALTVARLPPPPVPRVAPPEGAVPDDLQAIVYTSGTTGRPKGVMLTGAALRAVAEAGVGMLGLGPSHRVGIVTPLFHLYALREVDAAVRAGACLVLARNLTFPAAVLRQLQAERVSYLSGVPAGFALFVERYGEMLAGCRGHLRAVALGTAPCPPALASALRSLLPRARVILTYGLTETSRVSFRDAEDPDPRPGSIGRPYPGVEIRALDDLNRPLPAGSRGRISVRSAMAAAGYWRRPDATRELFLADRWILGPDRGRIDEDGWLYLEGRVDEVINSGGEKVSPDEVEAALRGHPQVADCAVLSADDPEGLLGQIVLAVVVPAPGGRLDESELARFCSGRLEVHKVPRAFRIVDSLPRTALGKVDRGRLRAAGA
jgi:acyl-CoA synthetase (AMP-forming)/AMP-acid ligase II